MRTFRTLLLVGATATAAFCSPAGVLEMAKTIQVDPTVIEQPDKVKDPVAANLVRYNLRAAVRDADLKESDSSIHTHFVLDEFSPQGSMKRVLSYGTGRSNCTVDGRLVIADASGKELASVKIHVRGSVSFNSGDGIKPQATSDLERNLREAIESLK